jgi:hypothetical protein
MGIPDRYAAIYAQILPVRGEEMRLFGFFQLPGPFPAKETTAMG